jgi:hypothetical protein
VSAEPHGLVDYAACFLWRQNSEIRLAQIAITMMMANLTMSESDEAYANVPVIERLDN